MSNLVQFVDNLTTEDDAPTTVGDTFELAEDTITTVDVQASCIEEGASRAKIFNVRRHFKNAGGTVTSSTQVDMTGPDTLGEELLASVTIANTDDVGSVKANGVVDTRLQWRFDWQLVTVPVPTEGYVTKETLEEFDFSTLWLTPSVGSTWSGTDSAGDSSTGQTLTKISSLSLATAVNGVQPVFYDDGGTGCHIGGPTDSDAYGEDGGTMVILAKMISAEADSADTENNPGLVATISSVFQMGYSDEGLRVGVYNAGSVDAPAVEASVGDWHVFAGRYTEDAVEASVDKSLFGDNTTAAVPPTLGSSSLIVGSNFGYSGGKIADAEVLFVGTFKRAISDDELGNIYDILKDTFAAAGLA